MLERRKILFVQHPKHASKTARELMALCVKLSILLREAAGGDFVDYMQIFK